MSIDKKLDLLATINKVETPPFLFTRIKQKIHQLSAPAPIEWKFALAVFMMVILWINILILNKMKVPDNKTEQVFSSMQLSPSNYIYGDEN